MGKKLSTDEFIKKATIVHSRLYDYSKVEYKKSNIKVCIIDPEYGEFWQIPASHLSGKGCWDRARIAISNGVRLTTKQFKTRARAVHGNLYDYTKVEYVHHKSKVCIIDSTYGEFWQMPNDHLSGSGCPERYKNNDDLIQKDHIIPLSILGKRNYIDKERPLYRFLNTDANLQEITSGENNKKSDWISYKGNQIRARHHRNNYKIIAHLTEKLLNTNINHIIKADRIFTKENTI